MKRKTCLVSQCLLPRWSKGYCLVHQFLREDKKKTRLKRSYIKKVSVKGKKNIQQKRKLRKKDLEFFQQVWDERDHIDFETGEFINGPMLDLYMHHVLEKSIYPQFRYCKWNLIIISWTTHSKCHNDMDFVPKIKQYRQSLIDKYL